MGVKTFNVNDKTGPVAAARVVSDEEGQEVFIISAKAQVVRINLEDVKVTHGRYTQGVIIWRDREEDDFVASVACFTENDYSSGGSDSDDGAPTAGQNGSGPAASMESRDDDDEEELADVVEADDGDADED